MIILKISAAVFLILLVWFVQILFLPQAVKWGMNGHDWEYLLYFDSHRGDNLNNFFRIKDDLGNPYFVQIVYYLGTLRQIFGLHPTIFKLVDIFWKSLAAVSIGYLVYKILKDKLFAFFAIFFSIIFPSAAGPLNFTMSGINFLIIPFTCLFVFYYIQSTKEPKKILLASFFFFLAVCAGPARAYLILSVPIFIELIRLVRSFRPFVFLRRLLVFYILPYIALNWGPFQPTHEIYVHIIQVMRGNLYTLTLPFQSTSALFIDQSILKSVLEWRKLLLPSINPELGGFLMLNVFFLILSIFLGFAIKGRRGVYSFALKVIIPTLLIEAAFYFFGLLSSNFTHNVTFLDAEGSLRFTESLNPTVFQASIGGYYFILGLILSLEWWRNQRSNKSLMLLAAAWFWSIASVVELFLTTSRYEMIYHSNDRYFLVSTLGAVLFTAGIFTLSFKTLVKLKDLKYRLLSISIFFMVVLLITWKNYQFLYQFFYDWNEREGGSVYWQNTMYQRFLTKLGKENLKKPIFLYIDPKSKSETARFLGGSFFNPLGFRIFYDENDSLIRDNCKVVTNDIKLLEKAYVVQNREKGFKYDTSCIDAYQSTGGKIVFYPLTNFYAFRMENRDFVNIKDEILAKLDQSGQ
ncbi:hypothetical protein HYW41_02125 [Candidatus Daviesbacteria bacterium]|nr:hypothetical protein [Candidatus Daviesbacteria bacterium]